MPNGQNGLGLANYLAKLPAGQASKALQSLIKNDFAWLVNQSTLKPLLLFMGLLIIYLRAPALFFEPRFWAEEGEVYFAYAFRQPWPEVLLAPHLGYYSLTGNLAALIAARTVELPYAPLVTTLMALGVQLVPIAVILWSRSNLWPSLARKAIGVLIIIFTLSSGEIWLNTINSQFFWALTTFLILVETVEAAQRRQWMYRSLLAVSGLTGPVSCLLAPLFVFRAWKKKGREEIIQATILSICTLLQAGVFGVALSQRAVAPSRFEPMNFPTLISIIWTKSLVLPLFGPTTAETFADIVAQLCAKNMLDFTLLGLVLLLAIVTIFSQLSGQLEPIQRTLFLGSYLSLTLGSTFLAIGPKSLLLSDWFGQRYYYVPNIILLLLFLANIQFTKEVFNPNGFLLHISLLTLALLFGMIYYRPTMQVWLNESWPRWEQEVSLWQANPYHQLEIWPPGWRVILSDVEVRYHDADAYSQEDIPIYKPGALPWLDLLVRLKDEQWYGPERAADGVKVLPLPQGYRWETSGGFSSWPNGEAWWNKMSTVGEAILYGPDNIELQRIQLRIEFRR